MDINKRKAVYIICECTDLIWVEQKRPKIRDRDEYRPFWEKFEDAEAAMDHLAAGRRLTLYRVKSGKIESFRVRSIKNDSNTFTSKQQAKDFLEKLEESFDYTITRSNISVFYEGKDYNITASDKRFPMLRRACTANDLAEVVSLLNTKTKLKGTVEVKGSKIKMSGHEVPKEFAEKIVDNLIYKDDKAIKNFKKRLDTNPSKSAQRNLLKFLSHHGACLLSDGRFLAYKYTNDNFHDSHTGKYDYSPGKTVKMPRDRVVEDPKVACAAGLHVGSWGYSGGHNTVLVCVIDPIDVVSVPDDYGYQKIRSCKVKSIRRIDSPIVETVLPVSYLKSVA